MSSKAVAMMAVADRQATAPLEKPERPAPAARFAPRPGVVQVPVRDAE
jgi:hypothetical protein